MKEIAIVSKSLIVNELLKLIFKQRDEKINFIDIEAIDELSESIVIVDDSIDDLENTLIFLQENSNAIILLGDGSYETEAIVSKPFLQQDIEDAIENIQPQQQTTQELKTNVLDPDEIAHIKALMALDDDTDYEDDEEEELTPFEMLQESDSFKIKGKDAKELLYELTRFKTKELKSLLRGAKVTLKVTFKKSEDE